MLQPLMRGGAHAQMLSPLEQSGALDSIARLLRTEYVYDVTGIRCASEMEALKRARDYQNARNQTDFASSTTRSLRNCANDEHLEVVAAPPAAAAPAPTPPVGEPPWLVALRARNFDLPRAERLAGNIGYIELNSFPPPEVAGETVAAAMSLLAHTDAMIIDLRQNGGGTGDMVRFLATWFFEQPTTITRTWRRAENRITDDRTLPYVPGQRRPKVPLYILTSSATFSAAEAFAFGFQQLGRATIVGERTRGGANAGRYRSIGYGLRVFIPMANARSPVSENSWERVGVAPDVTTAADSALAVAHAIALRRLIAEAGGNPTRVRALTWLLEAVASTGRKAGIDPVRCAEWAGSYEGGRELRCRAGTLRFARADGPERMLIPVGNDEFHMEGIEDARLRFDGRGQRVMLRILDADGSVQSAARVQAQR
ncbi:MAG TPA: S41 family peptidase [Longimicrobiales bacterium]|nr:S41 family peptidase [Longimicrobiales bacterium]